MELVDVHSWLHDSRERNLMQEITLNWSTFGVVLVDVFFFGVLYALFVRWLWTKKVEGQTAWLVVGGVAVVLTLSIALFGLLIIAVLFALFAAAGLPMVAEYVERVHRIHMRDLEAAQKLARETVDDADASPDR